MMIIKEFVFEMQHGMNEFDQCIFARPKEQQEERPEGGFEP